MRTVYHAANPLEAHMLKGLLEQAGITGFIDGEFLSGGAGELPVAGVVKLSVNNDDFAKAREILQQWEAEAGSANGPATVEGEQRNPWFVFLLGVVTGVVLSLLIR